MKRILFFLILLPFTMLGADYYKGEITLNNGGTKSGFIQIPNANHNKIKFRATEKGDVEKLSIDNVKSFWVINENDVRLDYIPLKLANMKAFSKEFDIEKDKSWVRIERTGSINIVTAYYYTSDFSGFVYYLHKPTESHCYYITTFYGGATVTVGEFKGIKMLLERIFKNDCPKLAETLTKELYQENKLYTVQDLHQQLCGK